MTSSALVVEVVQILSCYFNDIAKMCRTALIKNGVHRDGDLELNSCFHRQPLKTL